MLLTRVWGRGVRLSLSGQRCKAVTQGGTGVQCPALLLDVEELPLRCLKMLFGAVVWLTGLQTSNRDYLFPSVNLCLSFYKLIHSLRILTKTVSLSWLYFITAFIDSVL